MKIIVRALALGMLLTGFAADHYLSAKTTQTANVTLAAANTAPGGNCSTGFCLP